MQVLTSTEFMPDKSRKEDLEKFIGFVCVGSTGRLGICTHVHILYGDFVAAGFGLDGKGVWTASNPTTIDEAVKFYDKLNKQFDGKLSYHDMASVNVDELAAAVADRMAAMVSDVVAD